MPPLRAARVVIVAVITALAVRVPAQAPAPTPAAPPRDSRAPAIAGTAAITGRIVGSDSGTPLRRAVVRVNAPELPQGTATITDKDGRYEIRGLPVGRYTITVNRPGYVTMVYGQRRPREPGTPITLADGEVRDHIDIVLPRGAALSGRVVDEFGDPVARVAVQSLQLRFVNGQKQFVPGGTFNTPDTGEFRLWDLLPGDYYLSATVRDPFADNEINDNREGYAPTYYPATEIIDEAQRLTLTVGQDMRDLVIALRPIRTAHVAGTVLGSNGQAVKSGSLTIRQNAPTGGLDFNRQTNIASGAFTFVNIPPGPYRLETRTTVDGKPEGAIVPIAVAGSDVTGVVLTTSRGGTLSGQIVFDGAMPAGARAQDVSVRMRSLQSIPNGETVTTRMRDDWTFEVVGLFGPQLIRTVTQPGGSLAGWQLKTVTVDGRDVTDAPLAFNGTETVDRAVITLTRTATTVIGAVTDDKGTATSDYVAIVFASDSRRWTPFTRFIQIARGDQRGQFAMRGLPPEQYLAIAVDAIEPGRENDPQFLERLQERATPFTVAEGETKRLSLRLVPSP